MLKKLLENKKFCDSVAEFIKNPAVLDVILFGSFIRDKLNPTDIDILILCSNKKLLNEDEVYSFRKNLEKIDKKFSISIESYSSLLDSNFLARESILSEGFSLVKKKFLHESFGYGTFIMFRYSLKELNNSKRMQFYYALYGRGKNKGIIEKDKSYKLSNEIILSSVENSEIFRNLFDGWRISYTESEILIPKKFVEYQLSKYD
jgi:predicted nucleotidyltransferase